MSLSLHSVLPGMAGVCCNEPLCKLTKSMFCFESQDIKSHVESKKQFTMWHRVTCPAAVSDLYPNEKPSYKHLPKMGDISCKHMLSA